MISTRTPGADKILGDRRTVNAPGTEKMTTFLPFHASVVSFEAGWGRECKFGEECDGCDQGEILTDTAGGVALELGGVVDGGELASGDGVADLDVDHFDLGVGGLGRWRVVLRC